jgi:hypothetical protein
MKVPSPPPILINNDPTNNKDTSLQKWIGEYNPNYFED